MRYFSLIVLFFVTITAGYSQSIDEQIANAINNGKWFELRHLYQTHHSEVQAPILHPMSQFFINHSFNQIDSAIFYGTQLLAEHQSDLGESVGSILFVLAKDFAKKGKYDMASNILKQYNDAMKMGGITSDPTFYAYEKLYYVLHQKGGFNISRPNKNIQIPFRYIDSRKRMMPISINAQLNNVSKDMVFDTGAGENLMSKSLAEELGLHIYDFNGIRLQGAINMIESSFAIVDSLRIGDIIYKNTPFLIADFNTNNPEADSVVNSMGLDCIIGVNTILPLEEIELDFQKELLKIPADMSKAPSYAPNIYCSETGVITISILDKKTNKRIELIFDTGSTITKLNSEYYIQNKSLFKDLIPNDTIRIGGIGGSKTLTTITISWEYSMDGTNFIKEPIIINTTDDYSIDNLFGIPSLVKYKNVKLNFKDMWIYAE